MVLENGMDIKSLSSMLGHVSSATTVNLQYGHNDQSSHNSINKIAIKYYMNFRAFECVCFAQNTPLFFVYIQQKTANILKKTLFYGMIKI